VIVPQPPIASVRASRSRSHSLDDPIISPTRRGALDEVVIDGPQAPALRYESATEMPAA
jgi:hypothetical protein